jgi:hypothetical protein
MPTTATPEFKVVRQIACRLSIGASALLSGLLTWGDGSSGSVVAGFGPVAQDEVGAGVAGPGGVQLVAKRGQGCQCGSMVDAGSSTGSTTPVRLR